MLPANWGPDITHFLHIRRICAAMALLALAFAAPVMASAQTPIPKPVQTALMGPGSLYVPGLGESEGVLSAADVEKYRRIFALQEDSRWREADAVIRRLQSDLLMGHVLAQRYLHPTGYRTPFHQLRDWMAAYADHPQARRIHRLAVLRQPQGVRAPAPPVTSRLGIPSSGERRASEGRPLRDRAETSEGRRLQSDIRTRVARGWPTGAKDLLNGSRARTLLDGAERAQAWRDIARGYFRAGKDREAVEAAHRSSAEAPDAAPLAYWWGGLAAWRMGRTEDAQSLFASLARSRNAAESLAAAGAFWAARAFLVAGRPEEVNPLLEIGARHPLTFYGQLSLRALGEEPDFTWDEPDFSHGALGDIAAERAGARAIALLQTGRPRDAELELIALAGSRDALRTEILALASRMNLPALALKLSWFVDDDTRVTASYPLPHWSPEEGFSIDRALVYAFVRQESAFDTRAESHVGARGLMQLMPRTASYVAGERDLHGRGKYRLYEPEFNLSLGQQYIAMLLSDANVSGDLLRMAAAYNAGPGNLRSWERAMEAGDDPLLFIESLPSRETRLFVERILTNLWVYRHRLGQPSPSLDDIVVGQWPAYIAQDDPETNTAARDGHGSR